MCVLRGEASAPLNWVSNFSPIAILKGAPNSGLGDGEVSKGLQAAPPCRSFLTQGLIEIQVFFGKGTLVCCSEAPRSGDQYHPPFIARMAS